MAFVILLWAIWKELFFMFITKQQDFEDFIDRANKCDVVAIDTEFLRDKTYWAKLCLLQMAIDTEYVLVDPFEVNILSLTKLFENKNLVKLFHSPRQDIEILLYKTKVLPEPIFDTQVAAAFLGHHSQIGYGNLVQAELGIQLKKGDTYSDWSIRPLSKSQLDYAKDDVTYLLELYKKMKAELEEQGRLDWAIEDTNEKYASKDVYEPDIYDRYTHLKRASSLKPYQLGCARELAAWRENEAMRRNIPRRWVLSDEFIVELSRMQPKKIDDIFRMRGAKGSIAVSDARKIIECINKAKKYSADDLENLKWNNAKAHSDVKNEGADLETDLMSAIVKLRAKENNIAPQTLSSNSDLNKIARGTRSGIATLSGWRKKIVGDELLDLIDGKLSLSIDNDKLKVSKL